MKYKLRPLSLSDAPLMLEWMHDESVVKYMKTNFSEKSLLDCENFIVHAQDKSQNIHLAIIDESNEYMGTVSLKKIMNRTAEFGITIRSCAMGKGCAQHAMEEMLHIGFDLMRLEKIYWCVAPENERAVRFYDKHGYERSEIPKEAYGYSIQEKKEYLWYTVFRNVY